MFEKHEYPGGKKIQISHFFLKYKGQGHKVIDPGVIWKGVTEIWSLYLSRFQSYGQG